MGLKYEKEFFYAGKTGGDPMEIWFICIFGDILISFSYKFFSFSKLKNRIFLRSFCEIAFLSLSLYFLVYSQSPFFILFLFFMLLPYFKRILMLRNKNDSNQQIRSKFIEENDEINKIQSNNGDKRLNNENNNEKHLNIKEKAFANNPTNSYENNQQKLRIDENTSNNCNSTMNLNKINDDHYDLNNLNNTFNENNNQSNNDKLINNMKTNIKKKRSGSLAITKLDVLFLTAICIIFVDFQYFPSRFAKVSHHYGFVKSNNQNLTFVKSENTKIYSLNESKDNVFVSLMDTGAAFFIILNGFSSLKPKNSLRDCCINFALWFIRRITTEATNYYTPEGEYSAGCNFFGYISIVQFFSFISSLLKIPSFIMLFITMIIHEFSSCKYPILGYVFLFYLANTLKYYPMKHFLRNYIISMLISLLCSFGVMEPLRETANTPFGLFVMSILCCTLDINDVLHIDYDNLSFFMKSIDCHSLFYFLICNIFTGLINLFIDTNNSNALVCFCSVNFTFIISSLITMIYHYIKEGF